MGEVVWTEDKKKDICVLILRDIEVHGMSLRKALSGIGTPNRTTFYEWLEESEELANQYARACEARQENKYEEILEIADDDSDTFFDENGNKRVDSAAVQKKRLQIDARKWQLSKENPKKYGDKIQQEHSGEIKGLDLSSLSTQELIERAKAIKKLDE